MIDSISEQAGAGVDLKRGRNGVRHRQVSGPVADRLPPHSLEAEMGILGCLLLAPQEGLGYCVERFPKDLDVFYDLRHQTIYNAMRKLSENMKPVDVISLHDELKTAGVLEQVGGIQFLNSFDAPSAANLSYYVDIVVEKFTLRRLLATCTQIVGEVYDGAASVNEFMDRVERDILAIRPAQRVSTGIKSLVREAITQMEYRCEHPDEISGFHTGLGELDKLSDGLHRGEVVVVAGMTSTGKTALAVNIATHNALNGVPTVIFTAEMLPVKIAIRMICAESESNFKRLAEHNIQRLVLASGRIASAPIYIEAASNLSIGQVTAVARRLKQKHDIQMVVIDYLQLLSGTGDNREQQISSISKGIRALALELNCAVMALSQLTDEGKLRESRSIGHDADSVWKLMNDGNWQPKIQPIVLTVEKCRDGETGEVKLMFFKEHTRFKPGEKFPSDL